jgi:hypothetical protein
MTSKERSGMSEKKRLSVLLSKNSATLLKTRNCNKTSKKHTTRNWQKPSCGNNANSGSVEGVFNKDKVKAEKEADKKEESLLPPI